jgi:thermostable 8-oxoguanine DNA glycosylase
MSEESEALRELEETIQDKNYVRAEKIVESIGKPPGEIKELLEKAYNYSK